MTNKAAIRPLIAILFVISSFAYLTGGQAALAANQSIDITGSFQQNLCTGEPVVMDGQVHLVTTTTPNTDGSFHVHTHINTQGVSGTGLISGDPYNFNDGVNQDGNFDVLAGGSARWVGHTEFIHKGEGNGLMDPHTDDEHIHFVTTVVLDVSGSPVVSPVPDFECR